MRCRGTGKWQPEHRNFKLGKSYPPLVEKKAARQFLNTWWIVLVLLPTLLFVQRFVIAPEERYLHRRFGAEYEAYTRRVGRWL